MATGETTMKTFVLHLPEDLHRKLKARSLETGQSMAHITRNLLTNFLEFFEDPADSLAQAEAPTLRAVPIKVTTFVARKSKRVYEGSHDADPHTVR